MKYAGRYCFVENEYDLDHIINEAVDKTKEFVVTFTNMANSKADAIKILKAITETIIDEVERM